MGPLGLEPRTNGLKVRCSNQLSYGPRAILTRGKTPATIAFFPAKQAKTTTERLRQPDLSGAQTIPKIAPKQLLWGVDQKVRF